MTGLNRTPKPFSESRRRVDTGGSHWRARKRDIIFMLSPRVSTVLLPVHSWEREEKERERDKVSRHRRGARPGPVCKHCRWRILIATHTAKATMQHSFDTCIPKPVIVKPSNRIAKKAMVHFFSDHFSGKLSAGIEKSKSDINESISARYIIYNFLCNSSKLNSDRNYIKKSKFIIEHLYLSINNRNNEYSNYYNYFAVCIIKLDITINCILSETNS